VWETRLYFSCIWRVRIVLVIACGLFLQSINTFVMSDSHAAHNLQPLGVSRDILM
jgi:hypothetical protein